MQTQEKLERPLKWFVLPNESYKWDFILEKYFVESQQEAAAENVGIERLALIALTRTLSSLRGYENNETTTTSEW